MSVNDRVKIKFINEEETNGQSSPLTGDETTLPITRRVFDIYTIYYFPVLPHSVLSVVVLCSAVSISSICFVNVAIILFPPSFCALSALLHTAGHVDQT